MSRTIGYFHNGSKASFQLHFAAFVRRVHDFVGEADVKIIERWAGDDTGKGLDNHVGDLVGGDVDVIVAAGGPPAALAAKKATLNKQVPVVFMSVADPVGLGLVASLDHPGGHMTGIAGLTSELDVTRLQLLREFLGGSRAARVAVLNNASRPHLEQQFKVLNAAAADLNFTLVRKDAGNLAQIEQSLASFKGDKVDALLVTADSMFNNLRKNVVALAKGVPAIYQWREFAEAGGLMSFGPNIIEAYEKVGEYVGHILDGAKPAELPVALPDRFELVINLRVAHAEGFHIPASLLSRADIVRHRLRIGAC